MRTSAVSRAGLREERTLEYSLLMVDLRTVSDAELIRAYLESNGEPGDPEGDALAAELERRGLDI